MAVLAPQDADHPSVLGCCPASDIWLKVLWSLYASTHIAYNKRLQVLPRDWHHGQLSRCWHPLEVFSARSIEKSTSEKQMSFLISLRTPSCAKQRLCQPASQQEALWSLHKVKSMSLWASFPPTSSSVSILLSSFFLLCVSLLHYTAPLLSWLSSLGSRPEMPRHTFPFVRKSQIFVSQKVTDLRTEKANDFISEELTEN